MTATIFFSIFFSLFISHLPRPLSESTGSTKEVGASSSSTSNLDDIKQRLVNSIKNLLDIDIEHNSDLDNNKQQQQDNIMSVPTDSANDGSINSRDIIDICAPTTSTSHRQREQHHPAAQRCHHLLEAPRQQPLPNSINNFAQLLRQLFQHRLLGQQHTDQPQHRHAHLEAPQRLHQQHATITTGHGDNISIRMAHLPDRGRTSTLSTT